MDRPFSAFQITGVKNTML